MVPQPDERRTEELGTRVDGRGLLGAVCAGHGVDAFGVGFLGRFASKNSSADGATPRKEQVANLD